MRHQLADIQNSHERHRHVNDWNKNASYLYHIRAWGSDSYPDMIADVYTVPRGLSFKYPYIDITRTAPVSHARIMEAINGQKAQS